MNSFFMKKLSLLNETFIINLGVFKYQYSLSIPPQKIFYVSMGDTKGSIGLTWINTQISFNVAALLPGYSIGDTNF